METEEGYGARCRRAQAPAGAPGGEERVLTAPPWPLLRFWRSWLREGSCRPRRRPGRSTCWRWAPTRRHRHLWLFRRRRPPPPPWPAPIRQPSGSRPRPRSRAEGRCHRSETRCPGRDDGFTNNYLALGAGPAWAPMPTLVPPVAGKWSVQGAALTFIPSDGYVPWSTVRVYVPRPWPAPSTGASPSGLRPFSGSNIVGRTALPPPPFRPDGRRTTSGPPATGGLRSTLHRPWPPSCPLFHR